MSHLILRLLLDFESIWFIVMLDFRIFNFAKTSAPVNLVLVEVLKMNRYGPDFSTKYHSFLIVTLYIYEGEMRGCFCAFTAALIFLKVRQLDAAYNFIN